MNLTLLGRQPAPNQILIACKKILDTNKITHDKNVKDFLKYYNELTQINYLELSYSNWIEIYDKLCNWFIQLEMIDNIDFHKMLYEQKLILNKQFTQFIKNNKDYLIRPDKWWKERAILSRSLIYKKKYAKAYKVSSNHSLSEGPEFAEAEWLSGWIALTFLDDPNLALQHFKSFYDNVGYPISLSRGAYWIGKTYKKIKNKQKSEEWFNEASKYLNT